jgi:hypothetical protein
MKKKNNTDIVEVLKKLEGIFRNIPTSKTMEEEVRMMHFKIRPLQGDISRVNFNNIKFVETLWKLGKLDDFFQTELEKVSNDQKQILLKTLHPIYEQFQNQLNSVTLKANPASQDRSPILEMEIMKERIEKKNTN